MKRIMIMGCGGTGKSTLSKQLHQITQIPLVNLDKLFWNPNWVKSTNEEWREKIKNVIKEEQWITDGNYSGTWDLRIPRADTLIYLIQPTYVCFFRVLKRTLKNYGKVREGMPAGCPEKWDWVFMKYILTFKWKRRKDHLNILEKYKNEKQVLIFRKKREVESFLKSVTTSKSAI